MTSQNAVTGAEPLFNNKLNFCAITLFMIKRDGLRDHRMRFRRASAFKRRLRECASLC